MMQRIPAVFAMVAALLVLGGSPAARAQDADREPDPCAVESACRHIAEYVIEDPNGTEHRFPAGVDLPWVSQGNIILTPGEAVVVELVEVDGMLVPRLQRTGEAAREGQIADGEIRFDFTGFNRGQIMLSVQSAYPAPLEYAALLVDARSGPERTSVCTLMPGVAVFESWQQPIIQLALWSFRPTQDYGCAVIDPESGLTQRTAE